MGKTIQEIFNNAASGDVISLPPGEFEGCFYIDKPCTVVGGSTTLWSKKGPVLSIKASEVKIESLRIEVTETGGQPLEHECLHTDFRDTQFTNIEINGKVVGVTGEEGLWDIPKLIPLGELKSEASNTYLLQVNVPVTTTVASELSDVVISPTTLPPGRSVITITTAFMKPNTFLYGELRLISSFTRRIYLSGRVVDNPQSLAINKQLFTAPVRDCYVDIIEPSRNINPPLTPDPNIASVNRGQRMFVDEVLDNTTSVKAIMSYTQILAAFDIDPYVFLLDNKGTCKSDEDLVFFGNSKSTCEGVVYSPNHEEKNIFINFGKVEQRIDKIVVAYSIYEQGPHFNFSKVKGIVIRIFDDHREKLRFEPQDLVMETTVIAMEFYRYKDRWKMNVVGSGYKDGLKKLCKSFNLEIIE